MNYLSDKSLPILSREQNKKVEAAYWNFQALHIRHKQEGDALAMGELEAFTGVVKQLLREAIREERNMNGNHTQGNSRKGAGSTIGIDCDSVPYVPTARTLRAIEEFGTGSKPEEGPIPSQGPIYAGP